MSKINIRSQNIIVSFRPILWPWSVPKKELSMVLPYLRTLSSNLKQKLRTCFKNLLPQCNIKIILKSTNRLSSLFRFKDVIPKELQSHLVYKFSCGNCNVTYYGKTERHLNVRSSELIGISHLTGKRVEWKPPAVLDHLLLHNHESGFNEFTILCPDNNGFRLLLKESILILEIILFLIRTLHYSIIIIWLSCLIYYQWDLFSFLSNIFWHNTIIISLILIYKNCVTMSRELAESLQ